jgi:hypothetical protein
MSRIKMTLSLTSTIRDRLTALRVNSDAASDSEVVRNALAVYELLVRERNKGHDIIIREKDGSESRVVLTS